MGQHASSETELRGLLAQQLEAIERGLELIEEEFYIAPAFGCTKSFIDILAKDRHGSIVIVELKRADSASRQALHEIKKYSAAVRGHFGKGDAKIRTIVVSTNWDELARPFSDTVAETSGSLEGFVLSVDGVTLTATRFEPLEPIESLSLCPIGSVVLAPTSTSSVSAMEEVADALLSFEISDFFLVHFEYRGPDPRVIYPHAVCVVRRSMSPGRRLARLVEMGEIEDPEEGQEVLEGNPWYAEECELAEALNRTWRPDRTMEILGPEKLQQMSQSWLIVDSRSEGACRRVSEVFGIEECLQEYVYESDRPHTTTVAATVRPDDAQRLAFLTDRLNYCLTGNDVWLDAAARVLAEADQSVGDVIIECFCPMDIFSILLAQADEWTWTPPFLLIVRPGADCLHVLLGRIERFSEPLGSVAQIIQNSFRDDNELMLTMHFHEIWDKEIQLMTDLGLRYVAEDFTFSGGQLTEIPNPSDVFEDLEREWSGLHAEMLAAFAFMSR